MGARPRREARPTGPWRRRRWRPARPRGRRCAHGSRRRHDGRRVRRLADAAAGRRGRRRGAAPAHRAARRQGRDVDRDRPRSGRPRRRVGQDATSPTAASCRPTSSSSPPACGRATSWRATPACELGERGGVIADEACATSDESIFAIGEVALHRRTRRGAWSAPGYSMAEVVVDRLLGGEATFDGRRPVHQAQAARRRRRQLRRRVRRDRRAALEVVYADPVAGVYKKLVMSDDAQTLLGGMLVGDASRVRHPAADGRRRARQRPDRMAAARGRGAADAAARCPTTPTSAPATTSPPARSAAR